MNYKLFILINSLSGNYFFDKFFIFSAEYIPFIFVLILTIAYLSGKKDSALFAFYAGLLGLLINFIISIFYFHPRPFMLGIGHLLIQHLPETSFPSDHATLAFSISFAFFLFQEKFWGSIGIILSIILSFARIYTGVHFPFDIAGSIVVSISAAILIKLISKKLLPCNNLLNNIYMKIFGRKK